MKQWETFSTFKQSGNGSSSNSWRIQISGNFVQRNNCGQPLNIGKTCTVQVAFKPHTTGTQTGAINIIDSAMGASQKISLTGIGK